MPEYYVQARRGLYTGFFHHIIKYVMMVSLVFTLSSCTNLSDFFSESHPKPIKKNYAYKPELLLYNLTLARLELPTDATKLSSASSSLHLLQSYSMRKRHKNTPQPILIMDYKTEGNTEMQEVIAPISMSDNVEFPELQDIMNRLGAVHYTLYNISLARTHITLREPVKLAGATTDKIRQQLDREQQYMLKKSVKFPVLDDAREQLNLIRFFMKEHFRDAAYISIENVRQILAAASQNHSEDAETITQLSKDLDSLEGEVHTQLPFTLSNH